MAAKNGHLETVGVLLGSKALVNYQNAHGTTALHWAVRKGTLGCIRHGTSNSSAHGFNCHFGQVSPQLSTNCSLVGLIHR